ncbi:MAG TPA: S41 family peptidase [bacterium]|nr:S41 family peptidase [bacterium]
MLAHRRLTWHILLTTLVVVALAVSPLAAPAQAADQSLVFEALQALQTNYVDAVDPVQMLNAALLGMRQQLSTAGIVADLPDFPRYTTAVGAKREFAYRFTAAVTAGSGQLTTTQLAYAAIRGMTSSFNDSHTGFLTPQQNEERRQRQRGQAGFTGVGVVLLPKDGRFFIWAVIPGGPAEAAGVHEFDRIAKINGLTTGGMTVDQVSGMIRGPEGSPVTLTLARVGVSDPLEYTITRQPIIVPAVFRSELLDGRVGYLRLYQFVDRTGDDVRNAIAGLLQQGMRALVLDLRGNSGGYLSELDRVLNILLPRGLRVYAQVRPGGKVDVVRTTRSPLLPATIPLIVLVDEGSASAAELLAAAIKENHRGTLVGAKTAGAVEASILHDLSDGSALSITAFRLTSGLGVRLEHTGVEPDVAAALTATDLEVGVDRQFGTALQIARQVTAQPTH